MTHMLRHGLDLNPEGGVFNASNKPRWYWVRTLDIKTWLGLRDATTRDTLRRLAARGMLLQHRRTKLWRVNLPATNAYPGQQP